MVLTGIRLSAWVHFRHKTVARSRWLGLLCNKCSTRLAASCNTPCTVASWLLKYHLTRCCRWAAVNFSSKEPF